MKKLIFLSFFVVLFVFETSFANDQGNLSCLGSPGTYGFSISQLSIFGYLNKNRLVTSEIVEVSPKELSLAVSRAIEVPHELVKLKALLLKQFEKQQEGSVQESSFEEFFLTKFSVWLSAFEQELKLGAELEKEVIPFLQQNHPETSMLIVVGRYYELAIESQLEQKPISPLGFSLNFSNQQLLRLAPRMETFKVLEEIYFQRFFGGIQFE